MIESVFKQIISQGISPEITVQETLPRKGKPAQKNPGSTTVYIIKIGLGEKESTLKAARGGPREWSSLDKLDKWLKGIGISAYTISHTDLQELLQQSFTFANNGK